MAYKIQTRKAGDAHFADASEWLTFEECIAQMRTMSLLTSELQVVNEKRHIIATTLEKNKGGEGNPLSESALADSMVER